MRRSTPIYRTASRGGREDRTKSQRQQSSFPIPFFPHLPRSKTRLLALVTGAFAVCFLSFLKTAPNQGNNSESRLKWLGESTIRLPSSPNSPKLYHAKNVPSQVSSELFTKPHSNNTVICLVAMDNARKTYLTERCVRSIRSRGNFTGYILVFTDVKGFAHYGYTLSWDAKVIVIQGRAEDLKPRRVEDGKPIEYTKHTMVFRRFKTLPFKYIDADPRFPPTISYVLYLDVDNVVSNPLGIFFQDYYEKIRNDLLQIGMTKSLSNHSYISFWVDPVEERDHLQGGQFMVERTHGQGCLDAWKHQMDTVPSDRDQPLLMNVAKNVNQYGCIVSLLPDEPREKHFNMLEPKIIVSPADQYPTIVHISGLRTRIFSEVDQRYFLRKALLLENGVNNTNMIGDITWEDVIDPVGLKLQRPDPDRIERQYSPAT